MSSMPTWLKIALPVLIFVVVLVAALVALVREDVPSHGQPAALEARFSEQLAFLRELAVDLPLEGCQEHSREELLVLIDTIKAWQQKVETGEHLFEDPAILGAEILQMCDGSQSTYGVKSYEGPESTWSASMLSRRTELPSATLWFAGTKRQVRYDTRAGGSDADPVLIRLILDLESL